VLTKAFIPYRGYYSTPFVRWQGRWRTSIRSYSGQTPPGGSSSRRGGTRRWWSTFWSAARLPEAVVLQRPLAAGMMGAAGVPGVLVSQACSTSAFAVYQGGMGVETGLFGNGWCLLADRCSNGPHASWPNPNGPGGQVISEDWVMDNFGKDPWAGGAMIQTAENVSRESGVTRAECDAITLRRQEQYEASLADDRAFQKRYMFRSKCRSRRRRRSPSPRTRGSSLDERGAGGPAPRPSGRRAHVRNADPPGDGNCGVCVTTREKAKELSADPKVEIRLVSFGFARTKKAFMAAAVAPSAQMALANAGIKASDLAVVTTHNPFAANDIVMAKAMGLDANAMNNFGSSLIYGHPQAPTGARAMIEGIEEAAIKGGGYVLYSGCAAGDTAASIVLKVG